VKTKLSQQSLQRYESNPDFVSLCSFLVNAAFHQYCQVSTTKEQLEARVQQQCAQSGQLEHKLKVDKVLWPSLALLKRIISQAVEIERSDILQSYRELAAEKRKLEAACEETVGAKNALQWHVKELKVHQTHVFCWSTK
jgi:hypothetical protein